MGNASVEQLSASQLVALKREGIRNVKDLVEFKDNDANNVILNLRQPKDIWHPTIPTHAGSAEIAVNNAAVSPMIFQAAVAQSARIDALAVLRFYIK